MLVKHFKSILKFYAEYSKINVKYFKIKLSWHFEINIQPKKIIGLQVEIWILDIFVIINSKLFSILVTYADDSCKRWYIKQVYNIQYQDISVTRQHKSPTYWADFNRESPIIRNIWTILGWDMEQVSPSLIRGKE